MLNLIIAGLSGFPEQHARSHAAYQLLDKIVRDHVVNGPLTQTEGAIVDLGGLGRVELPYHKMGAIDSLDLFGLDELIIFSFYWANRQRYRNVADIGANIGLHSILMARCGWSVQAYEPDPVHAELFRRNTALNGVDASLFEAAVSDKPGRQEFVRVLGNTTSSHLAGAKANPYGELERFSVDVLAFKDIIGKVDFIKMDAEGQEKAMILSTRAADWNNTDMMVEVGTPENAEAIFTHLRTIGANAFAQKRGWGEVASLEDMPTSYKEGSLFVTSKSFMPWSS